MGHRTLLVAWILAFFSIASGQEFTTHTYYQDDTTKLELDLFLPRADTVASPLLIFVHGGGFGGGDRGGGHKLAAFLSKRGVAAASITYTLYMKDKPFGCDGYLHEKIKAIQIAANQLWLATEYLVNRADTFRIDPRKVFIAGSSAGAETALHAAFWERRVMDLYGEPLDSLFRYSGVISGAGAIMDLNLITTETIIPVMLIHGDEDPLVPYGTAAHHYCDPCDPGWLMLFGARSVYDHIQQLEGSVRLMTYKKQGHHIAGRHFYQDHYPVYGFIRDVLSGKRFQSHEIIYPGDQSHPPLP